MDFLELMNDVLFPMQKKFPDLRWDIHEGHLSIHVYVGQENGKLLEDARQMFS